MKNLIILITLFSISWSAFAGSKCETCIPLDKMARENFRQRNTVKNSQDLLMNFEISKNSETKSQEIQSYLKLALKAVQADGSGISDEYFYNVYIINKSDFDIEINKMKSIDKRIIKKSLKTIDEARRTDDSK